MWKHLLEVVLLGTEKKPMNQDVLPDQIREFVSQRHADSELKFLETASLCYFYIESGKIADTFKGEIDERLIEETLGVVPKPLLEIFEEFEKIDYLLRDNICSLWLDSIIKRNEIISPEYVVRLLQFGNNFSQATKNKILQVIGNKGLWILSFMNELQYKMPSRPDNIWLEGDSNQRKAFFKSLRNTNHIESIELLKTTWTEESVVTKRTFLEIIKEKSFSTDIPFLEEIYQDEFSYHSKEKKTEKECRRIIVEILLSYSETQLHKSTMQGLSNYLSKSKKKGFVGLVTGKEQFEFDIPSEEDVEFWNSQNIEQKYGFETKNYDIAIFSSANQFWFSCLLNFIPMNAWSSVSGITIPDITAYFLDNFKYKIEGKIKPVFLESLIENALYFSSDELAKALLPRLSGKDIISLMKCLKLDEFEKYVTKNKYCIDIEILQNSPVDETNISWSKAFTEEVIINFYEAAIKPNFHLSAAMGKVIAQFAHLDALPVLFKYQSLAQSGNIYQSWNKNIFEPVHASIKIKSIIDSYNTRK